MRSFFRFFVFSSKRANELTNHAYRQEGKRNEPAASCYLVSYKLVSPSSPMHIQHFEKGLHYTDRDLLLFAKKIGKLATYCERVKDESSIIRVEAEMRDTKKDRDMVKMTVQVDLPHKILRAESRRETALDALERCIEKLEPQITRYKEMHVRGPAGSRRSRRRSSSDVA